jgi:hypothetical protein
MFDIKYPGQNNIAIRFEPAPNPIMGGMEATGRVFPCTICGKRTQWVTEGGPDCPGSHICSDECMRVFEAIPTGVELVEEVEND